jgi:hypothetical protein
VGSLRSLRRRGCLSIATTRIEDVRYIGGRESIDLSWFAYQTLKFGISWGPCGHNFTSKLALCVSRRIVSNCELIYYASYSEGTKLSFEDAREKMLRWDLLLDKSYGSWNEIIDFPENWKAFSNSGDLFSLEEFIQMLKSGDVEEFLTRRDATYNEARRYGKP